MRFKTDENIHVDVAAILRAAGHDVSTVPDQGLGGQKDQVVGRACVEEERALITQDLHFANVGNFPPEQYAGLIVFRLRRQDVANQVATVGRLMPHLSPELLAGRLWIVDEQRIRVRGKAP